MSPGDHASTAGVEAYTEDHDVARGLYLTDPDGNQVEIYADTVKDWRTQRHGTIMADSPTWSLADTAETRDILYHENPEIRRVAQATFHPTRTARVAVVVSAANYDASLDFYRQYAVLEILWQDADRCIAVFGGQLGERSLTLLRAGDGKTPGLHHVGLEVADAEDLANSIAAARRDGIETFAEIHHNGRHSVCIRDLDGTALQFFAGADLPFDDLSGAGDDDLPYLNLSSGYGGRSLLICHRGRKTPTLPWCQPCLATSSCSRGNRGLVHSHLTRLLDEQSRIECLRYQEERIDAGTL